MEMYFNSYKIKFDIMEKLLRENEDVYIKYNDTVNVFINLEPIFIKLCNPKINEKLKKRGKHQFEFISCVINLAAHYRWFFTKHKINSRIYLYCSSLTNTEYKNLVFNKDYRVRYNFRYSETGGNYLLYKTILSSIQYIELITEYLPDVHFICSNNIENSLVPAIILQNDKREENEASMNFIVSSALYDIQYVNKKCFILLPKLEKSALLYRKNIIPYMMVANDCSEGLNVGPKMLPFILSILGNKDRNIYNIKGMGIKTTFKLLEKALRLKAISNDVTSIHMLLDIIKKEYRTGLMNNYYCTDIDSQMNQLNVKDIHNVIDQIVNRFDNSALKNINDKYFYRYPLQIIELTTIPCKKINY